MQWGMEVYLPLLRPQKKIRQAQRRKIGPRSLFLRHLFTPSPSPFRLGVEPIQEGTSPGASYRSSQRALLWTIPSMAPGEAHKFELHVSVADWLSLGKMLINQVEVSCDQVGPLTSLESALFSDCPWLRPSAEARALVLPTLVPSSTPSPTRTVTAEPSATPLRPTVTPILLASNPPRQPLDLLTLIVAAVVAVLFVVTLVLIYRRIVRRA